MALAAVCPTCGNPLGPGARFCVRCGRELPQVINPDARVQALATVATSQDQVTWLAFSLAMTTEAVLLAAFIQDIDEVGRLMVSVIGALTGLSFLLLVARSNVDMKLLFGRGDDVFPDVFHLPNERRFGPRARHIMTASLVGWILFWTLTVAVLVALSVHAQ